MVRNLKLRFSLIFSFSLIALFCGQVVLHAGNQEELVPLEYNPVIQKHQKTAPPPVLNKNDDRDTLTLPFFDDFSSSDVYPLDSLWMENKVFINNAYPVDPISKNVATFDGLDENGEPYRQLPLDSDRSTGNIGCDTMTSAPIDLSGMEGADSIYLSFYYQPQGKGDPPEPINRLYLEFKPEDSEGGWETVWEKEGSTLKPFQFVAVHVPEHESRNFFHNSFQFRFVNQGNPYGNLDHWHIDYVVMDEERTYNDSISDDITVVNNPSGVLSRYRAMPRYQYLGDRATETRDELPIRVHNLSGSVKNVEFSYQLTNLTNNTVLHDFVQDRADNVDPGERVDFTRENDFDITQISDDYFDLELTLNATTTPDRHRWNDTFSVRQEFEQYIAYDDGIPEVGFRLNVGRVPGKLAQRYQINRGDSLRAVGIHFNRSREDITNRRFDLIIWDELTESGSGESEDEILHIEENLNPKYSDSLHGFTIYFLEEPVYVENEFYVGTRQRRDYIINIGMDKTYTEFTGNDAPNPNLFINVNEEWQQTSKKGALMIRPYLSPEAPLFVSQEAAPDLPEAQPGIYPNPASEHINIEHPGNIRMEVSLYNLQGQKVTGKTLSQNGKLNISDVSPGLYIIEIQAEDGLHTSEKIRITDQ